MQPPPVLPASSTVMDQDVPEPRARTPRTVAAAVAPTATALFGAAAALGTWYLTVTARAYCDAGFDAGGKFELNATLPVIVLAGVLCALAAGAAGRLLTRRVPTALRVCVTALLVVAATALLCWWYFATRGTLDGYPGDSGLCPPSNIPPWWPVLLPA